LCALKSQGMITFEKLKQVARSVGEKLTDDELWEMILEADKDGNCVTILSMMCYDIFGVRTW
jgi:Ca2+-binding EF-hand superfamily protein